MGCRDILVGLGAAVFTRSRSLLAFWARRLDIPAAGDVPWSPLRKPPRECTVALVTTAGVHLSSDAPFDMKDRRGDPSYREIPSDVSPSRLTVTHDYYDSSDAVRDINVVFPVGRLREMAEDGEVGGLAGTFYSFMGHLEPPHIETLRTVTAVEVARKIAGAGVDLVLLTPA